MITCTTRYASLCIAIIAGLVHHVMHTARRSQSLRRQRPQPPDTGALAKAFFVLLPPPPWFTPPPQQKQTKTSLIPRPKLDPLHQ